MLPTRAFWADGGTKRKPLMRLSRLALYCAERIALVATDTAASELPSLAILTYQSVF